MSLRVLVVGAGGVFGRRLVDGLLATTDCTAIVAGRSRKRSEALAADLRERRPGRPTEAVALDRRSASPEALRAARADVVVDAAGPFQGANLHLPRTAIAAGCHFLDLADARDYVSAIGTLDAEARAAGVLVAAGLSSTPALSHAALDALTVGWSVVEAIDMAISPGNRSPRGRSVVDAVLSYAGRPVRVWRNGRWTERPGWGDLRRARFPGLGRRWLSLVETPDLDLLPARFPGCRTVLFRFGLEFAPLHLGLWALSLLPRLGLVRDLRPIAGPLHRASSLLVPFGTDRGGMVVRATGRDGEDRPTVAEWSLVAGAGDGPNVPTLPALAVLRALAAGQTFPPGARPAVGLLALAALEAEFGRFAIETATSAAHPAASALFERALGPAFHALPEPLRRAHDDRRARRLVGRVEVTGAETAAERLVARLLGLPARNLSAPAAVALETDGAGEVWTRRFGGTRFRTRMEAGSDPGTLVERWGPFRFDLALTADAAGFRLAVEGWRLGPLPLPRRFAPDAPARAWCDEAGRYRFDVPIRLPGVGLVARYRGSVAEGGA